MIRVAGLAFLVLIAGPPLARADFNQEIRRCMSEGAHPDIRIVACTRNILSGRFAGPNLAVAFMNRGLAYKKKGQWDRAIADYSEAIRLNSGDAEIFNNRGNAYYYDGQLDRAAADYDDAIRLAPDFAEAISNRGNIYRKTGRLDRAIAQYDRAIQIDPGNAQAFAERGLAYEKKGAGHHALRDFEKAHDLGFRHPLLLKKLREAGAVL